MHFDSCEHIEVWWGGPVRLLSLELLSPREKKMVDQYGGRFHAERMLMLDIYVLTIFLE